MYQHLVETQTRHNNLSVAQHITWTGTLFSRVYMDRMYYKLKTG